MVIHIPDNSDFSIYNIPFGIFSTENRKIRAGVAIGEHILDLVKLSDLGVFDFDVTVFEKPVLNDFISLGKEITGKVRTDIQAWLQNDVSVLANRPELFVKQSEARMHLPVEIGDYTDFYSSLEHAKNVGMMFRDPDKALLPNWKHIPVAYHGRSSSIVVSGQEIYRPKGQVISSENEFPIFETSSKIDFELEMGFIIGKETQMGDRVDIRDAEEYIFGLVLFNDWSARDIQKWEYVPLGPFLGKNFASSMSPWIVTLEAMEYYKVAGPIQEPKVLPYLESVGDQNYDIHLKVAITPENGDEQMICDSNFKHMYWNMSQQLAHHTVNGCNIRVGDLLASGTISGKKESSYGSMLELAWAGSKPILLKDGSERSFIHDGDTVKMYAHAEKDGRRVGFGTVEAKLLPVR